MDATRQVRRELTPRLPHYLFLEVFGTCRCTQTPYSCLVARLQVADVGEGDELFETLGCVSGDRLEQVSHMVADVIAVQHGTDEPALRVVEDRDVLWAWRATRTVRTC